MQSCNLDSNRYCSPTICGKFGICETTACPRHRLMCAFETCVIKDVRNESFVAVLAGITTNALICVDGQHKSVSYEYHITRRGLGGGNSIIILWFL